MGASFQSWTGKDGITRAASKCVIGETVGICDMRYTIYAFAKIPKRMNSTAACANRKSYIANSSALDAAIGARTTLESVALLQAHSSEMILAGSSSVTRGFAMCPGLLVGLLLAQAIPCGGAADWPQFLGPARSGVYSGPALAETWPKEGPPVVWQRKVGPGFSGPVVSGGKLILFHRLDDNEVVECLDAKEGKVLWKADYPTGYQDDFGFDPGPRATPSVADGRVYTFGAEGTLNCWNLQDGQRIWRIDAKKQFGARKGFFGLACSPHVESNAVIVNLGGRGGAGVVAFARTSGQVLWKVTDDEASYASPIAATIGGRRYIIVVTREALLALSPTDGRVIFRYEWRPPMNASVSAATPLVIDDLIFISASYGTGARLLRFKEGGPETIWSADDVLSNHYATSVPNGGFLYGWDGRQEQGCELRCVELKTGKVRWSESGLGAGTVTLAGNQLLVLTEKGELLRAPATSAGFKPTGRAQILPYVVRAHPALADGFFYARSKDRLVCVDLRPTQGGQFDRP
jgi:outer membrane protein assembly factor BamB